MPCDYNSQPIFEKAVPHAVKLPYLPYADPGWRSHDNELLTRQLQLCTESLEVQKAQLHALSDRLQQLEQDVGAAQREGAITQASPPSHPQTENCVASAFNVHDWPMIDALLARAGSRSAIRCTQRHGSPKSSQTDVGMKTPIFEHEVLPRHGAGHRDSHLDHGDPIHLDSNPQTVHLSRRLLSALLRSYVRNMHVLHPIVDLKFLESVWCKTFDDTGLTPVKEPMQSNVSPHSHGRPRKRKRGSISELNTETAFTAKDEAQCQLETALAYMVLALGAICSQKEGLPRPEEVTSFSAVGRPVKSDDLSRDAKRTGPGMVRVDRGWHFTKYQHTQSYVKGATPNVSKPQSTGNGTQSDFLLDIGRRYYGSARRIVYSEKDGADLIHAQLYVLAGLYETQMGEGENSMKWIRAAGQIAMKLLVSHNLLHPFESEVCEDLHENYRRVQRLVKVPEHDFIVLTAWSCIQLEGEILAIRPLISSGIQALESRIPWPYRIPNSEAYARFLPKSEEGGNVVTGHYILVFYTSQLWIRKWLNTTHEELRNHDDSSRTVEQICSILREQQSTLDCWRACLPEEIRWDDSDPAADGILSAKLRAAYWAAQYAISQVYLDYVLHVAPGDLQNEKLPGWDAYLGLPQRRSSESRLSRAIERMPTFEIMQCTKRCIKAATANVIAFDRIPHKLIATNIEGIANA